MRLLLQKVAKVGAAFSFLFIGGVCAAPSEPLLFKGFSETQPLLSFTGQLYKDTGVALSPPQIYQVKPGDTLYGIANEYGTTALVLAKLNNIASPASIKVGQALLISPWYSSAGQGTQLQLLLQHLQGHPQKRIKWVKVDANDNLYRIGQLHKAGMERLRDANKLDKQLTVHPGQKLQLPVADYWTTALASLPWQDEHYFYLAREGQSVLGIAQQLGLEETSFKVIAPRVLWVNNFKSQAQPVVENVRQEKTQTPKRPKVKEVPKVPVVAENGAIKQKVAPHINSMSAKKVASQVEIQGSKPAIIQDVEEAKQVVVARASESRNPAPKPESQKPPPQPELKKEPTSMVSGSADKAPVVELPVINGITFSLTRQLDDQDLLHAEELVVGKPLEMASLQPALDFLNQRYQAKDFKLSQAMVQQQQVDGGIIHIELVEAKVGQVFLADSAGLDEAFVTQQISVNAGDDVNVGRLDSRLQRYNRYHSAKATVALQAGEGYGESDIAISMVAPRTIASSFAVTNKGAYSTGKEQHVWNIDIWNLSGLDDQLAISSQHSKGINSSSVVYSRHLGTEGASLSVSGSVSSSNIIDGPLSELGVKGRGRSVAIEYAYPMLMGERLFADGTLGYARQYSETSYSGGAVSQNSLSQKYSLGYRFEYTGERTVWSYVPKYQVYMLDNLDALGASSENTGHKLVSDFQFKHMLSSNVSFGLTNSLQYSVEKDINSLEQFSIGGPGSVRSFGSSAHAGDSGAYIGAQIESSVGSMLNLNLDNVLNNVQLYAFYDWAVAKPYRGEGEKLRPEDFFSGFGVGVAMPVTDTGFSFDFFVGQPENTDVHSDVIESDKPLVLGQMKVAF